MPFFLTDYAEYAERRWMTFNSRRYGRACDQCPTVIKRDPLVRDRDNDLERALRSVLELSLLRKIRFCVSVLVLVPECVITPPRSVLRPIQGPSMRGTYRKHANGK